MRHAYLIMCHNNWDILNKILDLLDSVNNEFFIHVDKKVRVNISSIIKSTKYAKVHWVERMNIKWGGVSQIECELRLLKAATSGKFDYYHLLSGVDFPIKTNLQIDEFFIQNAGKEFIAFAKKQIDSSIYNRVALYRMQSGRNKILSKIDAVSWRAQKLVNVNRLKDMQIKIQKGSQWFSISHALATYVVKKEDYIRKMYRHTWCCDEVFLQTLVVNSSFAEKLYYRDDSSETSTNMRLVDFVRGCPYVFTKKDFQELIESPYLFARKFDMQQHPEIVNALYTYLKEREKTESERK